MFHTALIPTITAAGAMSEAMLAKMLPSIPPTVGMRAQLTLPATSNATTATKNDVISLSLILSNPMMIPKMTKTNGKVLANPPKTPEPKSPIMMANTTPMMKAQEPYF